jgi:hypothetical protein
MRGKWEEEGRGRGREERELGLGRRGGLGLLLEK